MSLLLHFKCLFASPFDTFTKFVSGFVSVAICVADHFVSVSIALAHKFAFYLSSCRSSFTDIFISAVLHISIAFAQTLVSKATKE